ncbi:hypothetical protein [Streptomyces sp. B6B3]|uniref:hypothetical protein n=1 Tax=Streptomyces sp. B6B3 TaxID=3153570 RepID=UPI00325F1C61
MSDAATNFVLMLTERDVTIPDALEVYTRLAERDLHDLHHIAVKDVGADPGLLGDVTDAAHADGRSVLLEVADMSARGQEAGVQLAIDLGVEKVVATWREDFLDALKSDDAPQYWPFLGALSGSPLRLGSSAEELYALADELGRESGVGGVVLMPYRQEAHEPSQLLAAVTAAATAPVLVAGGVSETAQIERIARAGAWGFTMGSALLGDRQHDPASVGRRISDVLRACRTASRPVLGRTSGK